MIHSFVTRSAERFGDREALVVGDTRLTWSELDRRSNALARGYQKLGVAHGDRVHLYLENTAEAVVAWWAAHKAGAIPTVLNPLTKADKLAWYLNDARAALLVGEAQLTPFWSEAARKTSHLKHVLTTGAAVDGKHCQGLNVSTLGEAIAGDAGALDTRRDAGEVAAIIYTSGSTGQPKGVMLTHANIEHSSGVLTDLLEMNDRDVVLSALTLAFNYGLYQTILTARVGAKLVLERSFAFPVKTLERIAKEKATGFPGVPTMYAMMAPLSLPGFDFSAVRFLTNTAAALTPKHVAALERLFPNAKIHSMYGLTETKRLTALPPKDLHRKPDSVGLPVKGTELWLIDEHGQRLEGKPGQVGELVARGPNVMKGYWEKPEANAKALQGDTFRTGDLFRFDDESYLYFVSRKDDVIKSRGEKVAPVEVENALTELPGIKEAAVIGVPDEVLGQAVKAFVVLEEGAALTEREIQKRLSARLELFMVPKIVAFVPALPKTPTGKISKIGLS
ncbi:MAG: class I adenylate-forming enzyme family protein [Myxococcaceae bacterium]